MKGCIFIMAAWRVHRHRQRRRGQTLRHGVFHALQHLGYVIPPQADAGWIGEAGPGPSYADEGSGGPENDFTQRNATFMTWNLMHMARLLKAAGGIQVCPPESGLSIVKTPLLRVFRKWLRLRGMNGYWSPSRRLHALQETRLADPAIPYSANSRWLRQWSENESR
jgi:hypothetical protein